MATIPDNDLFSHSLRISNKVIVITGAANGIGRETALKFAKFGAKVIIGDCDVAAGHRVVSEIEALGGQATFIQCNVVIWDEQVAMFEHAIAKYGAVDVVIPNAGVGESAPFGQVIFKDGKPVKPSMRTIDINILGVLYTVHLAQYYLLLNHKPDDLKSIVLMGSMASWQSLLFGELYSSSKHAILGLMRSLHMRFELKGISIRVSVVHPFFADTGIVPLPMKLFLAGIPLTPVDRIAGAIFYAATNPDKATNGCAWLLPDNGPVFMVPREEFKLGVYKMIDDRGNGILAGVHGVVYCARTVRDLCLILGKPVVVLAFASAAVKYGWDYRAQIVSYVQSFT